MCEQALQLCGSRINKAKLSRPFLARSFPSSLTEGSVRPERFGASPMRGPHARSGTGAPVDDGGKQTQAAHKGSMQ
jgi:hypothetical protein